MKADTVDLDGLFVQTSETNPVPFSYMNDKVANSENLISCYLTYTNDRTHQLIRDNLHLSDHVIGDVTGPRYCPSLESKVERFTSRDRHQVWLEPEALDSVRLVLMCLVAYNFLERYLPQWNRHYPSGRSAARSSPHYQGS